MPGRHLLEQPSIRRAPHHVAVAVLSVTALVGALVAVAAGGTEPARAEGGINGGPVAEASATPTAPALDVEAAAVRSGFGGAASRATERQDIEKSADAVARPAPVVMPLEEGSYRSTSPYGERTDPFTGARALHAGTDMAAPRNTPIHAVAGGVVDYVGPGKDGRSGMLIVLKHRIGEKTVYSWYNHMFEDGVHVEEGQKVRAGDVIGGVGANGKATGTHLHLEIHTDEELTTVDPLKWLAEHDAVDVTEL